MLISKLETIKSQKNVQDEPTSEILNAIVHLIKIDKDSKAISHVANEVYHKIQESLASNTKGNNLGQVLDLQVFLYENHGLSLDSDIIDNFNTLIEKVIEG